MKVKKFSKTIDSPLPHVYRWCTDFTEDDPKLTDSTWQRRVLEKTRSRRVFVDIYGREDGNLKLAVNIVSLRPPNFWHLDFFGDPRNEAVDYRLTSLGEKKTRLHMVFRFGLGRSEADWFTALRDKFAPAIEKDYRSRKKQQNLHSVAPLS